MSNTEHKPIAEAVRVRKRATRRTESPRVGTVSHRGSREAGDIETET